MTILTNEGLIAPGEILLFSSWIEKNDDTAVLEMVRSMAKLSNHPYLDEARHSGTGSFHSVEEFLVAAQNAQVEAASTTKKREFSAIRRNQFGSKRAELELALIDRDGYVCSHPDCNICDDLTIDHIVALSRGGSDELDNLCFLCRSHNSAKGDK